MQVIQARIDVHRPINFKNVVQINSNQCGCTYTGSRENEYSDPDQRECVQNLQMKHSRKGRKGCRSAKLWTEVEMVLVVVMVVLVTVMTTTVWWRWRQRRHTHRRRKHAIRQEGMTSGRLRRMTDKYVQRQ